LTHLGGRIVFLYFGKAFSALKAYAKKLGRNLGR